MKKPWQALAISTAIDETEESYQDNSEQFLIDFFDKPQSEKQSEIKKILNSTKNLSLIYELSEQRKQLLDWYEFDIKKSLLDIGTGSGTLIDLFTQRTNFVTVIEPSVIKSKTISKRWADKENIEIINGKINEKSFREKFDYINMTDVIQHIPKFVSIVSNKDTPYEKLYSLFRLTYKMLKKDGILIISSDNPLALSSFSGSVDSVSKDLFTGLEGYLQMKDNKLFSLTELKKILTEENFILDDVYFAFPNHRLAKTIASKDYLIQNQNYALSSLFVTIEDMTQTKTKMFSEVGLSQHFQNENIIDIFTPSFTIFARKK